MNAGAAPRERALSEVLSALAADGSRDRIAIADLLAALSDRAAAAGLLVFALPNVVPMPPGASVLLGAPLLLLAVQLAVGRPPWLPAFIGRRSMPRTHFSALIGRAVPWLTRAERLLRPRLGALARPPAEYVVGAVCTALALVVFLPIPFGNMLPSLAICLLALGVLERDGAWVAAGLAMASMAAALVGGLAWSVVAGAVAWLLPGGG
jgi:hypothetical protein